MNGLAADVARMLDPVALAEAVGMEPDPWQVDVLRSSAPRTILNISRQAGKSTIASVLALHTAIYEPGSLVLVLSPAQRQSQELFLKAKGVYRLLGRPVAAESENKLSLTLENGSRIICLPGSESTIRGFSGVRRLIVDEAARVPDELYFAIRPMLAVSGGSLLLLSTPFGTRGFFYEAWVGKEDWVRVRVTADECPRISAEFLEEERRTMGDWWYRQEYGAEFAEAITQAFSRDEVERAFRDDVEQYF